MIIKVMLWFVCQELQIKDKFGDINVKFSWDFFMAISENIIAAALDNGIQNTRMVFKIRQKYVIP